MFWGWGMAGAMCAPLPVRVMTFHNKNSPEIKTSKLGRGRRRKRRHRRCLASIRLDRRSRRGRSRLRGGCGWHQRWRVLCGCTLWRRRLLGLKRRQPGRRWGRRWWRQPSLRRERPMSLDMVLIGVRALCSRSNKAPIKV